MEIINSEEMKRLRIQHGLTQGDVAARLKIAEATVSRYEAGIIKKASPAVLIGYSQLFNVPISSLYENARTEWVSALEEAGLQDPRVAGFIEYLEEQAQKEAKEDIDLTKFEIEMVSAYRKSDEKTKHLVMYALGSADKEE
jgi:transcriptional regulator with XRE-family HTH domain